ncbi:MAG TPA: hypothetical protein VEL75_01760 [Candidatus Methylomirabilis sp.]|nr:hypothetical protein [Candidatus Methylomirabilis sp.]
MKITAALAALALVITSLATPGLADDPTSRSIVSGTCTCDQSPCALVQLAAGEQFQLTDVTLASTVPVPVTVLLASSFSVVVGYVVFTNTVSQTYSSPLRFTGAVNTLCSPADINARVTVSGIRGAATP